MALERDSSHAFCRGAPAKHLRRLGDFDGDGNADMLLRHADWQWRYHPMAGGRVLAGAGEAPLTGNPAVAVAGVGDFNGDGKDDLLVRRASGSWHYYPMNGRRPLPGAGAAALPHDLAWRVAGVGDFSGDGKDDVLLRRLDGEWDWNDVQTRRHDEDWRYHAMDGRAVLGEGPAAGLNAEHPLTTWVAGVGDLDGDGRDDVLLRRLDGTWHYYPFHGGADGQSRLFAGHGAAALPNDLAWAVAGVADFDGDGKDDVLLRHEDGRWLHQPMDGRTVLEGGGSGHLPANPAVWAAGVGDLDGDGKAEVLTRHGHDHWNHYALDDTGAFALGGRADLPGESAWGVLSGGVAAPPRASAAIGEQALAAGADATLDLSEHFTDDQALAFEVASSDLDVVRVAVADGVLTLTAVADGVATVTARDADGHVVRQTFLVVAERVPGHLLGGEGRYEVPLLLAASSEGRQGFVRVINRRTRTERSPSRPWTTPARRAGGPRCRWAPDGRFTSTPTTWRTAIRTRTFPAARGCRAEATGACAWTPSSTWRCSPTRAPRPASSPRCTRRWAWPARATRWCSSTRAATRAK